jgi:riboflavin transporter FmnP
MAAEDQNVEKTENAEFAPETSAPPQQASFSTASTPRPPITSAPSTMPARWSTRQLTTMALFIALGVILSLIEFPLIPGIEFLKYDASTVPALMGGFAYGPGAGCLIGVLVAWVHVLFTGNYWGAVMNTCIVIAYILPVSLIYRASAKAAVVQGRTANTASNAALILGLVVGTILTTAVAILMNLVVTPIYTGMPLEAIITMILPALLPFNLVKAVLNSVLSFILIKSLHRFIR